jgi:hypothetical protein
METVNFQCGHCGNLMGVSTEFLGQQVRCPTCQGIVLAPGPSAPAAADLGATVSFPPKEDAEPESIFSPPEDACEDVFGHSSAPRVEMPPEPAPPPPPAPVPDPESTQPFFDGSAPAPAADVNASTLAMTATDSAPAWMNHGPSNDSTTLLQPPVPASGPVVRTARRPSGVSGLVTFIVIFSLVSYAILATVYIFLLLNNRPKPFPLLENLPDVNGDNPGVKRVQVLGSKQIAELNQMEVPESLRVGLGQALRVGDLEVKPLKVELRKVAVLDEIHPKAEECPHESLVLTLAFRNLAADYRFSPLDNYFDRKYDHFPVETSNRIGPEPLTFLVVGNQRFFGGPAKWVPRKRRSREKEDREWLDAPGRKNLDDGLAPGATLETVVCTDGADPDVADAVRGYEKEKPLLYRVQVRRGLVAVGNKQVPATAVIGVAFTGKDVQEQ